MLSTPSLTTQSSPSPPASEVCTPPLTDSELPDLQVRRRVRGVLMRAGTSKGLFFRSTDLPSDRKEWHSLILAAMGSPDPSLRQLDGMGGGQSTSSKVAVVGPSSHPGVDVDYMFIQVPVDGGSLDFSGNCGNIASGVGPFAIDEGLVTVPKGEQEHQVTVRIRNVNTDRIIHSTFTVRNGLPLEVGAMCLDGVSVSSSPIRLDFIDPAGSMTGKLLPTGNAVDAILIPSGSSCRAFQVSCVDAANPFIFVRAIDLGISGTESLADIAKEHTSTLMAIREEMAVRMGLAPSAEAARTVQGTPKIAIVGASTTYTALDGRVVHEDEIDIWVRAFSMGRPHPAIPMTGAVCVGAAAVVPGSVVHQIVGTSTGAVTIGHGSGTMVVQGESRIEGGQVVVKHGSVYRTARRLMEGSVLYMGQQREHVLPYDK